jgi:hypothetical protein
MSKTLMNDVVQSVDGVAVKGFAGAGVSAYLSNFSLVVSIMVGLATLVYVCLKVYFLYKEKFKSSESGSAVFKHQVNVLSDCGCDNAGENKKGD